MHKPHFQNHEQVLTPDILVNDELSHDTFFLDQRKEKKLAREVVNIPFLKVLKVRLDDRV